MVVDGTYLINVWFLLANSFLKKSLIWNTGSKNILARD